MPFDTFTPKAHLWENLCHCICTSNNGASSLNIPIKLLMDNLFTLHLMMIISCPGSGPASRAAEKGGLKFDSVTLLLANYHLVHTSTN